MRELLYIAIISALEAGKSALKIYNSDDFNIKSKIDDSPITHADICSHKIIKTHLSNTLIPILSEEGKNIPYSERKKWEVFWLVDPLDGTKEFINRNGEFTVNIALIENGTPVIGVIYIPVTGVLYFSSKDIGAFKNSNDSMPTNLSQLILKSDKLPLVKNKKIFTIVASRSHMSAETEHYIEKTEKKHGSINLITSGSSIKFCLIAEGIADSYPRFAPTMEWDTAAGQAICEHAGFEVIDIRNQMKMKYNKRSLVNNWFLVN